MIYPITQSSHMAMMILWAIRYHTEGDDTPDYLGHNEIQDLIEGSARQFHSTLKMMARAGIIERHDFTPKYKMSENWRDYDCCQALAKITYSTAIRKKSMETKGIDPSLSALCSILTDVTLEDYLETINILMGDRNERS